MVGDPRWITLPPVAKAQAIAQRVLTAPDGSRWLFGAHARWYRLDQADGRWHLSAPPPHPAIRSAARPGAPGTLGTPGAPGAPGALAPPVPSELIPTGPDFAYDRGSTQAFVGPDVPHEVTDGIRMLIKTHRGVPLEDFPLTGGFGEVFARDVAGTIAAVWGTIMWCAYAPAFDGNEALLSAFGEFLARPLPGDDWVRWLPMGSFDALITLYAERMRSGAEQAGLHLARVITETAAVLRADARFRPRADALIAMVGPLPTQPWLDHHALLSGAVRQAWLARCPPHLAAATLPELSPGDHFRHGLYDLVETLGYLAPRGMDPRTTAAALVAADVAGVCGTTEPYWAPGASGTADIVARLYPWIDDELRNALYVALSDPWHPLRGCWPRNGALPIAFLPPDRNTSAALLGAAYATGLAWCRLTGMSMPSNGFAVCRAVVQCLIHERDDPD
ncbi:hypothetical protein ACFHYQ_05745 [Sphaerimonospora cavernae]|uniref:Uncharacterized protein n=1 Tax=Sphaerimonospora cavernae TaxID=1740611 RepID=A0ABV6U015_9ACTN